MKDQRTQIAPIKVRLRYAPEIYREDTELIFEFFMVYSRFEFALKQTGYRRIAKDEHVEPNWYEFSSKFQEKFNPDKSPELHQAFDYYLSNPPKIQVVENDKLSWKKNYKRENDTDFTWIIRSIGIVRNNLFHGGKFPWDQVRDIALLSNGLIILYECLDLDETLFSIFLFSL